MILALSWEVSHHVPHVEQGEKAEDIETPFVRRPYKRADQSGDDDDPCEERGRQDVGECQPSCEEKGSEEERKVDEPLDVPHVLHVSRTGGESIYHIK